MSIENCKRFKCMAENEEGLCTTVKRKERLYCVIRYRCLYHKCCDVCVYKINCVDRKKD
jgi:hypothetical protein